jgi:hypothetical protein
MNPVCNFLHIYHLDFPLEEKFLPSNSKDILWSNKFINVPLVEFFVENQDDLCFLWEFELWILTTQPSHSCTLAYCRPIHLISIEFQDIDNSPVTPPKNFFLPSVVIILQSVWSIWVRFFLHSIRIVRYKILWLKVEN